MALLDGPMRSVASSLVGKFGKAVTFTYQATGAYDVDTGSAVVTPTASSMTGVVEEYRTDELGDLIEAGDVKITFAALGATEPKTDDTVTIGGDVFHVVRVTSIWSGDLQALYAVQARR